MRWEFASQGKQFALDVEGPLSIDDIDSACDAALADEGLVQLPGYVAVEHIRTGKLRPVLLDYLDASRAFSLTYVNRRDWQPLRDALFVDFIGESLQDPKLFALTDEELRTFRSSP